MYNAPPGQAAMPPPPVRWICCNLRTWALVIGWMQTIGSVIGVICCIVGLVGLGYAQEELSKQDTDQTELLQFFVSIGYVLGGIFLVIIIISLVISSLLLHGAFKRIPTFLLPWIIWSCIMLGLYCIFTIYRLSNANDTSGVVSGIFSSLFYVAFQVFFIYTIIKYYKELKDRKRNGWN